jgi:hypothetical protein
MIIDSRQEYKVKEILDSCMRYNHLKYLIKWKGYDAIHDSWEVHQQVLATSNIIIFHCNHPGTAQHINVSIFDSIPCTRVDLVTSQRSLCCGTVPLKEG